MDLLAAQLGFERPQWPGLLRWLALGLVGLEYVLLLARCARGRSSASGLARAAAVLLGPATVLWEMGRGLTAGPGAGPDRSGILPAALWATGLYVLAAMAIWGLPAALPAASLTVLGALAVAWAVRAYRRTTAPVGRLHKAMLLAVRILAVLLLVGWAMRPQLEYPSRREIRRAVVLAVDVSRSMQRRDMPPSYRAAEVGEQTELIPRIESARQALLGQWPRLEEIAEDADLLVTTFAGRSSPATRLTDPVGKEVVRTAPADGRATAIGDALMESVAELERRDQPLAAVVLVSDGNQNLARRYSAERFAEELALRDVPLHTLGAGWPEVTSSTRSLQVPQLSAPGEVSAFHRLGATATVDTLGLAGRQVEIRWRFGEEVVETETLEIAEDRGTRNLRMVHVPLEVGYHQLEVEAQLVGEAPPNFHLEPRRRRLVHVVDRELRVLYLEGKVRYEVRFIAEALATGDRIAVDRRLVLRPLGDRGAGLSDRLEDWIGYHAILLGDLPARALTDAQHRILKLLVDEKGKGLAMIGGYESGFGNGGWQHTPLADVMCVDLARSTGQIDRPIRIVPTRAGRADDMLRIGEAGETAADAWTRLEPLEGADRIVPKQAATVLATTPAGEPMIVRGRYGAGRTLAVAFDTTYKWVLTPADTAELQKRFWRQVGLFLSAPKGNVWITTDRSTYDLDELEESEAVVEVQAGVEDASGRPVPEPPGLEIAWTDPADREQSLVLRREDGKLVGRLPTPRQAGMHRLRIRATVEGRTLQAEHRFEVVRKDRESGDLLADFALLRSLSRRTRGRFAPLRNVEEVLDAVEVSSEPRIERFVEAVPLWRRHVWPILLVIVALLCGEWALRKNRGLV